MTRIFFALTFFATTASAAPPAQIEAQYMVTTNGGITIGRASETFSRKGDTYSIRSVTRSEGVLKTFVDDQITVESSGRVGVEGLQPLLYTERRAKDNKRDLKNTFDWKMSVMHTELRGDPSDYWFPPGTQDRISIMYQFAYLPALGPALEIPMADRRKVSVFTWKLLEEARIATPAGEFDTRHYQRVTTEPKETKVDVWLAKERFNFPVRVVYDDPKGFKLDQLLVSLEAR